jgi:folate-binding protein YgfZ
MARTVLRIGGADRVHFLQGLVTNDLKHLAHGLVYAAILTPQGKYLADFFLNDDGDAILLDADAGQAPGLAQRLAMYRLRAAVTIEDSGLHVRRSTGPAPEGALPDPRHPALGWRLYGAEGGDDGTDFDAIRVAQCIPEAGIELIPNDTFILEAGFERLNGVDFRKGCYVGQEVTARMKHKTDLRKGLATVEVEGSAPLGTPLLTPDGKEGGTLYTQSQGRGIAYLRFDRAEAPLTAGPATVRLAPQAAAS